MHSILEIVGEDPASAGPDLVSLDDLKAALGITGYTEDAALEAAITFHSRIIAEYCNRRFGLADALENFTFDRFEALPARQALTLTLYPVTEITEVTAAGQATTDFEFDPPSGRLWLNNYWQGYGHPSYWQGAIGVIYSGGYDLPEQAPARLQMAVIQAVGEGRSGGGTQRDPAIREVQHGDTRISYWSATAMGASAGYLSTGVIELIKPYRRLHVA